MANTIQLKRSSTASNVPAVGELVEGELAINTLDERLFSKNSSGAIFELTDHDNLTNYVANEHIDWTLASQGTIHITNFVALQNVVEDTTPQLGGNLASNGFDIQMAANDILQFSDGADTLSISASSVSGNLEFVGTGGFGNVDFGSVGVQIGNLYLADTSFVRSLTEGSHELLGFDGVASAVNYLEIANSITGAGPELRAAGGDANIDLELVAKGTGLINMVSDVDLTVADLIVSPYLVTQRAEAGATGVRVQNSVGTIQGYLYADGSQTFGLLHSGGGWAVQIAPASTTVTIPGNLNVNSGLDVTGNITVTGTVDGVDIAALDTAVAKTADTETITGTWTLDGPVTTSDYGTGGRVKDGTDVSRPIGFNVMPVYEIDANDTFDLAHNGMIWHKDLNAAVTFTCANDATIPQGATYVVHNDDTEDLTIAQGTGVTVYWLEAGSAPAAGSVTVKQGGIVTVYKYSDTEFWVWGAKDAAAGVSLALPDLTDVTITAAATGDLLRYNGTAWVDYPDSNYATSGHTHTNYPTKNGTETITGSWTFDALTNFFGGIRLYDNDQIQFGTGNDAIMYFDGVDDLRIDLVDTMNLRVYGGTSGIEAMFHCLANGEVGLYYNGSLKLSTTNTGVNVTGTITADGLDLDDNHHIYLGTGDDVDLYFNATDFYIDLNAGVDLRIRGGSAGTDNVMIYTADSAINFYHNNSNAFATQQYNTTGVTSGGQVVCHSGTFRDIGFNELPTFNFDASDTLEAQHCGKVTGKTTTSLYTLTGPTSSDLDFPVGGVCTVVNLGTSGNYLISDTTTCTMYILDGSAAPQDIVGTCTLGPGGVATIWRYSSTAIYIWGSGLTV